MQINSVVFAFVFSILLHLAEIIIYESIDDTLICDVKTNRLKVTNNLELALLCVENASELFPHFIIPFIFWYMPAKISNQQKTLYVVIDLCSILKIKKILQISMWATNSKESHQN
jgi:hypothetical protein